MRPLIEIETRKLCGELGKSIRGKLGEDINFNFMASNMHLMDDVALLKFYTTLVAFQADENFKEYLLDAK